jgi:hypothetical protein
MTPHSRNDERFTTPLTHARRDYPHDVRQRRNPSATHPNGNSHPGPDTIRGIWSAELRAYGRRHISDIWRLELLPYLTPGGKGYLLQPGCQDDRPCCHASHPINAVPII